LGNPLTYEQMATPAGLKAVAQYANGVGPDKGYVIPRKADGSLGEPTRFVADAHAAGLLVHPYTFRAENQFLPTNLQRGSDPAARGDIDAELRTFLATGIDGLFIDQPDIAVRLRNAAAH
jgi:glycerophosphoryl diester phosphodiesterase